MRRVVAATVVLLAATPLGGCARGDTGDLAGIVGLQRLDGHVHAYVRMCDGNSVDTLRMVEAGGAFDDTWTFEAPVSTTDTYDLGVYDDTVTLLNTGNAFTLDASSAASSASEVAPRGLTFTSAELAELKPGKILVQDGASLTQLSEDGFEALAADACG